MIIKAISHKAKNCFKRLVPYILEEVKTGNTEFFLTRFIRGGKSPHKVIRDFEQFEKRRLHARSNSVKAQHLILSWEERDKEVLLQDEAKLKKLIRHFAKLYAPESIMCSSLHKDKQLHAHLVFSGIKMDGSSARITKKKFEEIKIEMERWQDRNLELEYSSIIHNPKKQQVQYKDAEYRINQEGKQSQKQQVIEQIKAIYKKSSSPKAFYKSLDKKGIETYSRRNKIAGIYVPGSNRKMRLKTLGFSDEEIMLLDKEYQRLMKLKSNRDKKDREQENELER